MVLIFWPREEGTQLVREVGLDAQFGPPGLVRLVSCAGLPLRFGVLDPLSDTQIARLSMLVWLCPNPRSHPSPQMSAMLAHLRWWLTDPPCSMLEPIRLMDQTLDRTGVVMLAEGTFEMRCCLRHVEPQFRTSCSLGQTLSQVVCQGLVRGPVEEESKAVPVLDSKLADKGREKGYVERHEPPFCAVGEPEEMFLFEAGDEGHPLCQGRVELEDHIGVSLVNWGKDSGSYASMIEERRAWAREMLER
jgi:hypothetical protein